MATKSKLKFTGPIIEFQKFTNSRLMRQNVRNEIRKAMIKNSLFLIRELKAEISGKNLTKNAPLTLAFRKNSIPLLDEKNLMDAMGFALKSSFESEVGYVKFKQSTGGKAGGKTSIPIQKLVELINEGFVIDITPAMRAAMISELRKRKGRKSKKSLKAFDSASGHGKSTLVVPARPYMEQVFTRSSVNKTLRLNWKIAMENAYRKQGARGGEHKER